MGHYRQGWRHRGNQANIHRPSNLHPAVEAEEDGRKDATDGGSLGRDEAVGTEVAVQPAAVGDQAGALVAYLSRSL